MQYVPALDGLRLIAILLVMAFHAYSPLARGGYVGVDLFFVLSGYLITRILGEEQASTGTINYANYARRRARRLVPALLFMLVVYIALSPWFWPGGHPFRDALVAALYLSDYAFAGWGIPDILRHTWSLSVEVHFYLLAPLLVATLMGRNATTRLLLIYAVLTAWRVLAWDNGVPWASVYSRFDTHATGLVMGCLIATLKPEPAHARLLWPGVIGLLSLATWLHWRSEPFMTWAMTLVEACAAFCVLGATQHAGLLAHRTVTTLGQLSYGAYLWHYPVARIVRESLGWHFTLLISALLGFLMAAFSWHYVESHFRKRPAMERG